VREKVATSVAEVDHEGVRLRETTMTHELLKVLEVRIRAESALDRLDSPTCKVGIQSLEEQSMPWFGRDLEKIVCHFLVLLLHRVVDMMRCFLIKTHLDPSRLPIRSVHHPALLEIWSRQGLVVNALRTRGREPLRSASRRLGFTVQSLVGNPGRRLVLPSGSPWLFRGLRLASGAELRRDVSLPGLHRLEAPLPHVGVSRGPRWVRMLLSHLTRHDLVQQGWAGNTHWYPTLLEICRHQY
jgi:hypothetical protein